MKASRIVVGKGRTTAKGETEWLKEYFEVEVIVEDEKQMADAKNWAESLIDGWLEVPVKGAVSSQTQVKPTVPQQLKAEQIPNFDPEDLMSHIWHQGSIQAGKTGTVAELKTYGWDFPRDQSGAAKFQPETMEVLQKGPVEIAEYEFKLSGTDKSLVSWSRKKK